MAAVKKAPPTAVATRKSTTVSTNTKPAGRGFEEADAHSFAIPFLSMLQKLSPQADADSDEYLKGAKPGMFINTVTNELFAEVELIPCVYQRRFNRWAPRDAGGGFKGTFVPSIVPQMEAKGTIAISDEGRWYFPMPDGSINEKKCDILTDTRMHFCLQVKENGSVDQVLVSLSRTQMKKSKNWMSLMQRKGGDMFGWSYICKSKDEENDKGKWKGWVIGPAREVEADEEAQAENFYESVTAGKVEVRMDQDRSSVSED